MLRDAPRELCAVKQMNSCEGPAPLQNTNGANELVCLKCAAMMHEEEPQPRVTDMLVVQFCNARAHGPVAISLVLLQERFASAPVHTKQQKPLALEARKSVGVLVVATFEVRSVDLKFGAQQEVSIWVQTATRTSVYVSKSPWSMGDFVLLATYHNPHDVLSFAHE